VAIREAVDSLFLCVLCFNCRLLRGFHTRHCTGFDPSGTTSQTAQTSKSTPLPRTQPAQASNGSNPNPLYSHASRYIELYLPNGSIEIAHTSRYAHATGKSELCILATRPLAPGAVITELKGSMADLTDDEDRELKCATATGQAGIRRDFSVIHSKQLKKNHLFLGPARFVNVSLIWRLPSCIRAYATQTSMIAATMLNCFERDVTSRSELSSPSPWERR
jgi:hypothetical protein